MNTELTILPEAEAYQLASCENRIEAGLSSFIEVGEALSAIREGKLYRATHGTFEDYCKGKWGFTSRRAEQLMGSVESVSSLPEQMRTIVRTESQARELSRVEPARREEVVQRAVEATGGKLTASAIREAAQPVEQAPQVIEMTPAAKNTQISTAAMSEAEQLWGVARSRLDNIRKNDPKREQILSEVIRYANNRIESKK